MPDNPNPQGKGQVTVLQHWEGSRPAVVLAKNERTLLTDYAISVLILSARFQFKPVPGNTYHLYRGDDSWRLSLIAPEEWRGPGLGAYVGACYLRTDMTWYLIPAEGLENDEALVDALDEFVVNFTASLNTGGTLEEGLPFYVPQLPFYQRLLATGLASSISQSAAAQGLADHSARYWLDAAGRDHLHRLPGMQPPRS